MLMKTSANSSQYNHNPLSLCDHPAISPEPLLKIKISRLKDGSKSFSLNSNTEGSSNGLHHMDVLNLKCDSNNLFSYTSNKFCPLNDELKHEENDSEETEEEDSINFILRHPTNNENTKTPINYFFTKNHVKIHAKSKPKRNMKNLKKFSLNKVPFLTNKSKPVQDTIESNEFLTTKSVGTMTDVNLLGPCQPGTFIKMPGFIWTDSAQNGMLLFKTTWKNQAYSGMLVEVAKDEWSFPKSRIFASCPGSRYKRKCKKPKEFNYIDSWKKRSRNAKQKARALRSLLGLEEFSSLSYLSDADHYDNLNILLPCLYGGCFKKFTSFVARQFHVDNCHTAIVKLIPQNVQQLQNIDNDESNKSVNGNSESVDLLVHQNDECQSIDTYIMRSTRWRKNTLPQKHTSKILRCFGNNSKPTDLDNDKPCLQRSYKGYIASQVDIQVEVANSYCAQRTFINSKSVPTDVSNSELSKFPNIQFFDNSHIAQDSPQLYCKQTSVNSMLNHEYSSLPSVIVNSGSPFSSSLPPSFSSIFSCHSSTPISLPSLSSFDTSLHVSNSHTFNSKLSNSNQLFQLKCNDENNEQNSQHFSLINYNENNNVIQSLACTENLNQADLFINCSGIPVISSYLDIPDCKNSVVNALSSIPVSLLNTKSQVSDISENCPPQLKVSNSKVVCPSPVYSDISDTVDETPLFVNRICDVNSLSSSASTQWKSVNIDNSSLNKWLASGNCLESNDEFLSQNLSKECYSDPASCQDHELLSENKKDSLENNVFNPNVLDIENMFNRF